MRRRRSSCVKTQASAHLTVRPGGLVALAAIIGLVFVSSASAAAASPAPPPHTGQTVVTAHLAPVGGAAPKVDFTCTASSTYYWTGPVPGGPYDVSGVGAWNCSIPVAWLDGHEQILYQGAMLAQGPFVSAEDSSSVSSPVDTVGGPGLYDAVFTGTAEPPEGYEWRPPAGEGCAIPSPEELQCVEHVPFDLL